MVGYTHDEMTGDKTFQEITHPDDLQMDLDYMERLLAGEINHFTMEKRYYHKDGSIVWVNLTVSPIKKPDTEKRHHIAVVEDITDRKLAEEALKESENKYRTLFQYSGDAILIIDGNKFVDCNPATMNMLGCKNKNELLNTHPSQLSPLIQPDGRNSIEKANEMIAIAFDQGTNRFEWDHKRLNGEVFPVEVLLTAIPFEGRKILHVVWRDITERKQIEVELKKSEERYALAMKGANDGLWDWNLLTDEVYYSPRWKSILGYAENEIKNEFSEWERLLHPDDLDIALSKVEDFLNNKTKKYESEFRMQHKDGHYINILAHAFAVKGEYGKATRLVGTHIDITERKKAAEKLSYQSTHDLLTGLINRREFERRAERLFASNEQDVDEHAFCYLDLDQFKVVNDTCGHAAGDELLIQLSKLIKKTVRVRDTLARLGGDEFGILMEHCSLNNAYRVATSILKAVQDYQFSWEGHSFRVGVSMGLVPITETTNNLTVLMKVADAACYLAKDKGRNRIEVYQEKDRELTERYGEMQWVNRIQEALDENRFRLYAQYILPLDNSIHKHYELLIRMLDEQGAIIPPDAFLPAAERYNLITQVDRWVIENAFSFFKANPAFFESITFASLNLSGASFNEASFLDFLKEQLKILGKNSKRICFEITETAAINNLTAAGTFIAEVKQFGCRFALDDFGCGLSTFGYLKNLQVDYLKIDGLFVKGIVDDPIDHAMVKAINEIGHVMGMQTIAEFVENDGIKGMLREIGVNYAQGYGIHKPQPLEELLHRSDNVTNINKSKDVGVKP